MSYNIEALVREWRKRDPYLRDQKGFRKFLDRHIKLKTIYLTDQVFGHPNIRDISREVMISVADFYKAPKKAEGYREVFFKDYHRPAWDSGGFQFLMGKLPLEECDPLRTVQIYKSIGVDKHDFPIQLDLPPRYGLSDEETLSLIKKGAEFYHVMAAEIPNIVPVVHGWTKEQLETSLEFIEDPDRLATATNIPTFARTKAKMTQASGTNLTVTGGSQYILDHVTSDHSHVLGAGTNQGMTKEKDWVMGHLNPHSSVADRLAAGGYQQSGMFVCDYIANTPERMKRKSIGSGIMADAPVVVDHVISSKPRSNVLAVGANQQSGMFVLDYAGNLKKSREKKTVASPGAMAEGIQDTIEKAQARRRKKVLSPNRIPKKHRAPQKVVLKRLALVLNMLRDRDLFILGGASPHFQHMIFCGGAKYSDTSSWRLKAYMASIYLPSIGARAIGYKETDPRIKRGEIRVLRACLKETSHPFSGMPVRDFLELGKMNVKGYYETMDKREWPTKPFELRALHNAWVLKVKEEEIANEFANSPDAYYKYLKNKRFHGHPILRKRLEKLWDYMHRPYVQEGLSIYLKGRR